jgi:hypothetical protein
MTTFQIKLLAAILMVCDHIGAVIFPKILILRFLGRLSFPLFAWLIGQGEKNTNNFKLYLLRLVILGVVSQPIYYLTFHSSALNILATLAFGLLAIRVNKVIGSNLFTLIFAALAQLTNAEYGAYGVFVIILLAEINFTKITWWITWISLNLLTFWLPGFFFHQFLAGLTPLILSLWNRQQGRIAKWFYPFILFILP